MPANKRHVGMNSRRLGAQRLPGACCKPFPSPPQLYPVKSPSVSSRAGNRRSDLLPKQPCSKACLLRGLHLHLLWDPLWGCSQAEHTLLALSTRAVSAKRCPENICPWCRTLSIATGQTRSQHLFWPQEITGAISHPGFLEEPEM